MTEITIKYNYTKEEDIAALRKYFAHVLKTKILVVVSIIIIAVGIVGWLYIKDFSNIFFDLIYLFILFLLVILYATYVRPIVIAHKSSSVHGEKSVKFDEKGIEVQTENLHSNLAWNFYKKIGESEKFYLLFADKMTFSTIPKHAFESKEQENSFRELITKKISKDIMNL